MSLKTYFLIDSRYFFPLAVLFFWFVFSFCYSIYSSWWWLTVLSVLSPSVKLLQNPLSRIYSASPSHSQIIVSPLPQHTSTIHEPLPSHILYEVFDKYMVDFGLEYQNSERGLKMCILCNQHSESFWYPHVALGLRSKYTYQSCVTAVTQYTTSCTFYSCVAAVTHRWKVYDYNFSVGRPFYIKAKLQVQHAIMPMACGILRIIILNLL